jgi:hypothetical protein
MGPTATSGAGRARRTHRDPILGFFHGAIEHFGGLCQVATDSESIELLLPSELSEQLGVGEEAVVTSNPEVAREEGALLLSQGHPSLERALEMVVAEGDVGTAHLPWPVGAAVTPSRLQERIRDEIPVEHGRIEVTRQPTALFYPVVRIGAMLSYSVALEHSVHEREVLLFDGRTGALLGGEIERALDGRALTPGRPSDHSVIPADLSAVARHALDLFEERARARGEGLARQYAPLLQDEIVRAEAYYAAMLASIEQRSARATPERQALLASQAETTRSEASRRRRELHEQHEPTHAIRPFLAHLIALPSAKVEVEVTRGPRRFPLTLYWLANPGLLLKPTCPRCGAEGQLIAGREWLGCTDCLAPRPAATESSTSVGNKPAAAPRTAYPSASLVPPHSEDHTATTPSPIAAATTTTTTTAAAGNSVPITTATAHQSSLFDLVTTDPPPLPPKTSPVTAPRAAPSPATRRGELSTRPAQPGKAPSPTKRTTPSKRVPGERTAKLGSKLAIDLWQAVTDERPVRPEWVARDSGFAVLCDLLGRRAPSDAIGIPRSETPEDVAAASALGAGDEPNDTIGRVATGAGEYSYRISWRLEAGRPVIGEIAPQPIATGIPLVLVLGVPPALAACLGDPQLREPFGDDPVMALLLDHSRLLGIPLLGRALAIWRWAAPRLADEDLALSPGEIAGTVLRASVHRSVRRTLGNVSQLGALNTAGANPVALRALNKTVKSAPALSF